MRLLENSDQRDLGFSPFCKQVLVGYTGDFHQMTDRSAIFLKAPFCKHIGDRYPVARWRLNVSRLTSQGHF
jgi:hypothetical protein